MLRNILIATALASVSIAATAGTASASAATTMSDLPAEAPLVDRLHVPVTMTISCSPSSAFPGLPALPGTLSVTIRQVVQGKSIAYGTGMATIPCDDTPHEATADVFPSGPPSGASQSPPFKKGTAVIAATFSTFGSSLSAGPQSIRLR